MAPSHGFSVVVAVHDARPHLPEFCEALRSLEDPPGGYEVVFVDNRSSDGSFSLLTEAARGEPRFTVLVGPGLGPAAARNKGVAAADGRFVAFTDPDTMPSPDWLSRAASAIDAAGTRAIEGAVLPWDRRSRNETLRNVVNEDGGRYMTANMIYERQLLEELGGFDETFRAPPFLEDTDLAFRTLDRGVEIPFCPEVRVRHRDVQLRPRTALSYMARLQWMALLASKHPQRYRTQLRSKVQALRPGDAEFLLAVPLLIAARRRSAAVRLGALAPVAVAARRVIRAAGIEEVPVRQRAPWILASLAAPWVRALHLARGAIRFGKLPT
jgi:GT2 family glycosyltransferase